MDKGKSRVYVWADANGRITRIEGEYTLPEDLSDAVLIDEGEGDRFNLAQSHYLDGGLYTDDGIFRWKLADGVPELRQDEEIWTDREAIPHPKQTTIAELEALNKKLEAQLSMLNEQTTMLEDCLLEIGEAVYA